MKGLELTLKSDSNQTKIPHLILKSSVSPERRLYYININDDNNNNNNNNSNNNNNNNIMHYPSYIESVLVNLA